MRSSLKTALTWIMVGVAGVGLIALAALIAITSLLHVVSRDLSRAIESVRVTDSIELQLLVHQQLKSPPLEGATRAALLHAVDEASRLVDSPEEQKLFDELDRAVRAYLQAGASPAQLATVSAAAHDLSLLNIEQARQMRDRSATWDRLANVAGIAAAMLLFLSTIAFLMWIRGPFRDASVVSNAMERFAQGDLDARAPEVGPQELDVMARTFNATAEALVRARDRQAEYIATAVHDLRTPLAAIQLAIGYVAPDRPLPPESRLRELVALIGRQVTRLGGLIGDVLNAVWIERGELTLLSETLDLRTIATEALALFRSLSPEYVFELSLPSHPLFCWGDRVRLEQVLNNLLSNAVKYSPPGSHVRVELSRSGDDLVTTVRDEGTGITPEVREQIFDPYHRRSPSVTASGAHLGLWVSQRVVEAHHGRIEVESHLGRGSTFRVILPASPSPSEARPEAQP